MALQEPASTTSSAVSRCTLSSLVPDAKSRILHFVHLQDVDFQNLTTSSTHPTRSREWYGRGVHAMFLVDKEWSALASKWVFETVGLNQLSDPFFQLAILPRYDHCIRTAHLCPYPGRSRRAPTLKALSYFLSVVPLLPNLDSLRLHLNIPTLLFSNYLNCDPLDEPPKPFTVRDMELLRTAFRKLVHRRIKSLVFDGVTDGEDEEEEHDGTEESVDQDEEDRATDEGSDLDVASGGLDDDSDMWWYAECVRPILGFCGSELRSLKIVLLSVLSSSDRKCMDELVEEVLTKGELVHLHLRIDADHDRWSETLDRVAVKLARNRISVLPYLTELELDSPSWVEHHTPWKLIQLFAPQSKVLRFPLTSLPDSIQDTTNSSPHSATTARISWPCLHTLQVDRLENADDYTDIIASFHSAFSFPSVDLFIMDWPTLYGLYRFNSSTPKVTVALDLLLSSFPVLRTFHIDFDPDRSTYWPMIRSETTLTPTASRSFLTLLERRGVALSKWSRQYLATVFLVHRNFEGEEDKDKDEVEQIGDELERLVEWGRGRIERSRRVGDTMAMGKLVDALRGMEDLMWEERY